MSSKTVQTGASLPESYEDLCQHYFIPRRIRDEVQLSNTIEVIDILTCARELNDDQDEFLDALSGYVTAYEADAVPLLAHSDEVTVVSTLQFLLEQNGMSAADLSRLLGDESRSLGTRILSGERELSKEHIKILASRFHVSADLFLR